MDLSFGGKDITLRGTEGAARTIVDCQYAGRGFVFVDGEGPGALIERLTVRNGYATGAGRAEGSGGGILIEDSSPTIRQVVFEANEASDRGGGLYCRGDSNPVLECCTFVANVSGQEGGGVACSEGARPSITNCTLAGNAGTDCGGIACDDASPDVVNTIIYGNTAGCAALASGDSAPCFTSCCVFGNAPGDALPGGCQADGTLFTDPLFCDPESGGFQLQACSPCAGAGADGHDIGACPVRCACTENGPLPTSLRLYAASPSPFSGTTALALDVPPAAGDVRLAVYNVRGELVRTLADGPLAGGHRRFTWSGDDLRGRDVPSGVYFVRCECGAGTETRKLVVLR
jgi:predicted outer membrane repeat protein